MALAPDARSAKAGKGQASPRKWKALGANERAVWGLCQGSAKEPYQTQIDLSEPAFRCSCPSRKFPCKHALGLLFLFVEQEDAFRPGAPPDWVTEWLESRTRRAERAAARSAGSGQAADPKAAARRAAQREARVQQGVEELALWLQDLVRQGLAAAPAQALPFWETPAARLVDAQASGLARLVRALGSLAHSGDGWQEQMLAHSARLYLLLEGYRRREEAPATLQADLRTLVGWAENQNELLQQEGVHDRWLVLGQRVEEESLGGGAGALRVQRIWLWGQTTEQAALILHFAPPGQALDAGFVAGTTLEAVLVYYPSAWPQRALLKERLAAPVALGEMPGSACLLTATAAYAAALAVHPWLEQFPLPLRAVVPIRRNGEWAIRDGEGYVLPLSPRFDRGWELLAISGGHPIDCFGEWDGRTLLPLSALADAHWTIF